MAISNTRQSRLHNAENLLITTRKKVGFISEESGFASQAAMANAFRYHHDLSPIQYRQKYSTNTRVITTPSKSTQQKLGIAIAARLKGSNVSEAAQQANYSSRNLYKQFLYHTDQTMPSFLNSNPMYHARNDMITTDQPLLEIAENRGFGTYGILKIAFENHSEKAAELGIEEYRNHLKISRAKRYLRLTNFSTQSISDTLGFKDELAFTSFFYTQTDTAPMIYRHQDSEKKKQPQPQVA